MLWAWMLLSPHGLGTRTESWLGQGCCGHRMLLEHERNYGLGLDALVTVCFWNTNGIMLSAWMLLSPDGLGKRTESWFAHGCSGHRMRLEHERNFALGMDALVNVWSWNTNGRMVWAGMLWFPYALGTRTELWFAHGCSGRRMLLEHERNYGLGMDALGSVCSWTTSGKAASLIPKNVRFAGRKSRLMAYICNEKATDEIFMLVKILLFELFRMQL